MDLNKITLDELYDYFTNIKSGVTDEGVKLTKSEVFRNAWNSLYEE